MLYKHQEEYYKRKSEGTLTQPSPTVIKAVKQPSRVVEIGDTEAMREESKAFKLVTKLNTASSYFEN
jgi:hypothetical protein